MIGYQKPGPNELGPNELGPKSRTIVSLRMDMDKLDD